MTQLTAVCHRSEGWWTIEVPEIPHLYSQAKRLDQVETLVKSAAALHTGKAPESFSVEVQPVLEEEDERAIQRLTKAKAAAEESVKAATRQRQLTVAQLRGKGLPVRDIATVMGVSPQRISKIAA